MEIFGCRLASGKQATDILFENCIYFELKLAYLLILLIRALYETKCTFRTKYAPKIKNYSFSLQNSTPKRDYWRVIPWVPNRSR